MLAVGEEAPDFTGTTADGSPLTLSSLRGRPVVLYFYPKADTAGCRREARGFTDLYPDLARQGHAVVGVSVDTVEAQEHFRQSCRIPFPLVADRDGSIARMYGVLGMFGLAKRITFFLDANGRVLEVVQGLLPGPHVRRAAERAGVRPPA